MTMNPLLNNLFPTLRRKITVAVVLVSVIAGGSFVFFAHRTGYSLLRRETEERAYLVADLMKGLVEHAMLAGTREEILRALTAVASSPVVSNAFILRSDGTVAVSAKPDTGVVRLSLEKLTPPAETSGGKSLVVMENDPRTEYVIAPITKSAACQRCHKESSATLGYFVMKISMDNIQSSALQHRTVNLLMALLTFGGMAGVIVFALSLLVVRPIWKLHTYIRRLEPSIGRLEEGHQTSFPLLPEPTQKDEIASLWTDFNNLIRRLNEANARVYELHQLQLEHADRLATTGEMAASMAHEIKNPLAGVMGALQVFRGELPEENARKEILSEMMVQLERMNHAVNDLLTYARPTPPVLCETDLREIIKRTKTLLSQQAAPGEITITTNMQDEPLIVHADPKQIQQVLWNIMLNGIQAMGNRGELVIAASNKAPAVTIRVTDTGCGIPPEQLENVFKPFYTTRHKGTGLGMTIVRRIVEQHKGTLAIASTVGKGTTVTITLPQHPTS